MKLKKTFFPQSKIFWISLISIVAIIFWSIFSFRWIFSYRFDSVYFKDLYDHSQWQIPLSPRTMGDSELYQMSGYSLVTGGSPFGINPEVPPLVKYMYGLAIVWSGNPYLASLFFYLASVGAFAGLSWFVLNKNLKLTFLAALFYLVNPLFSAQIGQIALDLPQMCFLFFHCVFLFLAIQPHSKKFSSEFSLFFVSGLFLGAFTASKIGFFLPIILLADMWILWKSKRLPWFALILGMIGITYAGTYFSYFLQRHTPIEWLKAQKWMIQFYRSSKVVYMKGMIFPSLLVGYFTHWTAGLTYIKEWNISWPISLVTLFTAAAGMMRSMFLAVQRKTFFHRSTNVSQHLFAQYVFVLTVGLIFLNAMIPFWPRYLMLVVPFLLLLLVQQIGKYTKFLILILLIVTAEFIWYSFPQPQEIVSLSMSAWENLSYPEVYNFTSSSTQSTVSRSEFIHELQTVQIALHDPKITILLPEIPSVLPWQNSIDVPIKVMYTTALGKIDVPSSLHLVRERNQWRIDWQWQSVLPQLEPHDQVQMIKVIPEHGNLVTKDGTIIPFSQPKPALFISVIPDKVQNSEDLNNILQTVIDISGLPIRIALYVTHPGNAVVPIGFRKADYNQANFEKISKDPSVSIDQTTERIYEAGSFKSPDTTPLQNLELSYPEVMGKLGGNIVLTKPSGKKITIFQKEAVPGKKVTLEKTYQEFVQSGYAQTP